MIKAGRLVKCDVAKNATANWENILIKAGRLVKGDVAKNATPNCYDIIILTRYGELGVFESLFEKE